MEFLYAVAELRNPFFNWFFETVTHLGEETFFLAISIFVFWCVNKREGYYILLSGFFGICLNQFLKIICRIDRPWVKDPAFQPVGDSKIEATGYSFPSGHTQNIATTWGAIGAYNLKKRWLVIVSAVIVVLVSFSRLYLGVHTLLDVSVSLLISAALIIGLRPLFVDEAKFTKSMPYIIGIVVIMTIGFLTYVLAISGDSALDPHNYASALKNACTLLGCTIGLIVVYTVDAKWVKFDTGAAWYAQIIKCVLGFAIVLLIKSGLSAPLTALFGNEYVARVVRYLLIVLFGGAIWPMTFKWFADLKIAALDDFGNKVISLFTRKTKNAE